MTELFNRYIEIYKVFWGDNLYQFCFYAAVVLICLFYHKKAGKMIFGLFPVVLLGTLMLPVLGPLLSLFVEGGWQYYARLFSMIPLPYTIALGFVLLKTWLCGKGKTPDGRLFRIKERKKRHGITAIKLICVSVSGLVFCLGGTSIYRQDWMQRAQNPDKLPVDAMQICEKLHADDGVTIAVPTELVCYIRQVDSRFYMPYGRRINDLGAAISSKDPDPDYVMAEAGNEGCEYIATYKSNEIRDAFLQGGWAPFFETDNYLVYKVEGVHRIVNKYDSLHRLTRTTVLDAGGHPVREYRGFCAYAYHYNGDNTIKQYYLDEAGNAMELSPFSCIWSTYTSKTRRLSSRYFGDINDAPVCINGRYSTGYEYDRNGSLVRETCHDANGNLVDRTDKHYAIHEYMQDRDNRNVGEQYKNANGELVTVFNGFARLVIDRDQNGNIVKESYYDSNDRLMDEVGINTPSRGDQFKCLRCSDGATVLQDHSIRFTKIYPNEQVINVFICLRNADTDEVVAQFGMGTALGNVHEKYTHEGYDGLYYLEISQGTSHAQEKVQRLVSLEQGDEIRVDYTIDAIERDYTQISNVSIDVC